MTFSIPSFSFRSKAATTPVVIAYGLFVITLQPAIDLLPLIRANANYLVSSERTDQERGECECWLRMSTRKSASVEIYRTGIDNYPQEELNPILVGTNVKNLVKSIEGDLVNRTSQRELVAMMETGKFLVILIYPGSEETLSKTVLDFLRKDQVRYQILCQLGRLMRFIVNNSAREVDAINLAVVIPVDYPTAEQLDNYDIDRRNEWRKAFGRILMLIEEPEM